MKLIQFHSGTAVGDAITNLIFSFDKIFKKNNFESEIYAEYVDKHFTGKIKDVKDLSCSSDDILIIHHSMGINCFDKIVSFPCKKILIYHNITPTVFFDDETIRKAIKKGIEQIKEYVKYVDYAVADSNYNRRDLISYGYKKVDVLPLHVSLSRLDNVALNKDILSFKKNDVVFLFVGRVVPNKKQLDVIKVFSMYSKFFNSRSKLFLIGDLSMTSYVNRLKQYCIDNGLSSKVVFTGKISDSDLKSYYSIADLFVCMSQHEGFCVPLLEAMHSKVPVIALKSSAVEEILKDSAVLFLKKSYSYIAATCNEIVVNKDLRDSILSSQNERLKELSKIDTEKSLLKIICSVSKNLNKLSIQIQGPFETSYSLAKVNRDLAESFHRYETDFDVSIYATEGPGDYIPKIENLVAHPLAKKIYDKSKFYPYPDIVIRNMYPPRVWDANGGLNFQYFGWEESYIPSEYISDFNDYLSGIGTLSDYVKKTLIDNGLSIPVKTIGACVSLCDNFDTLPPYDIKTNKKIKFLHISSAFPRKGIDVLIEGYYMAFTSNDDTCLILKTFPNVHNKVGDILTSLNERYPNHPEVIWINKDLSERDVNRLYKCASCYVHLARGEGFGLPVAEAMLARLPTIVCNNSGLSDFANENTCITVKFNVARASTHISNQSSVWFEPDIVDFVAKIQAFVHKPSTLDLSTKVNAAFNLVSTKYSHNSISRKWVNFINETYKSSKKPSVAMVSSWNTKCGIAEYTKFLVNYCKNYIDFHIFPNISSLLLADDESFVDKRLWRDNNDNNVNRLVARLLSDSSEIVHFQLNWGFISIKNLEDAIIKLKENKKIFITFHSTTPIKNESLQNIVATLNKCSALIVHQKKDLERLVSYGVDRDIVKLIPLGQLSYPFVPSSICKEQKQLSDKIIFGSYGFLLPHKGIYDVLQSIKDLTKKYNNLLFLAVSSLYDCDESKRYYKKCLDFVKNNGLEQNVLFVTDYLSNNDSLEYLRLCDFLIAPYRQTSESASGAIRFLFAAGRPVITSSAAIFDEFNDFVYKFQCESQTQLTNAIEKFITDKNLLETYQEKTLKLLNNNNWQKTACTMKDLYNSIK